MNIKFTNNDFVCDDNGNVDINATCVKFRTILNNYVSDIEQESAAISSAVNAVFDQHRGARLNIPYIVTQSLVRLNAQPDTQSMLTEKIKQFIRANSDQQIRKDKVGNIVSVAEPIRTRSFGIGVGRGNGIVRWSDVTKETV